jgi:hypothetical protein
VPDGRGCRPADPTLRLLPRAQDDGETLSPLSNRDSRKSPSPIPCPEAGRGRGLYFYSSRYYNPYSGHFLQPDSVVPDWWLRFSALWV